MRNLLFAVVALLVIAMLSGCTEVVNPLPNPPDDDDDTPVVDDPIPTPPPPVDARLSLFESSYSYPGDVFYHHLDGQVLNTGGHGQFKLEVYYRLSGYGTVFILYDTYGPVCIDQNAVHPVDLTMPMGTKDVFRFKLILYELVIDKWEMKEEQVVETPY